MVKPVSSSLPLVSVIVPAYNAAPFLARTLQSILAQTYSHFEVLVVDDGSTDDTRAIAAEFAQTDPRVILLHQANAGVAAARNHAIQVARGEFIAPIDADDIWYPEFLEKQVACLANAPSQVGVAYAWCVDINEADQLTGGFYASQIQGQVYTSLLCHNFLRNASASLIRKACLDQVGGYNCQFRQQQAQGCEDWDLYLRLAERYEFRVVPEFLVGYRKVSQSMSRNATAMAKSQALMLQTARRRSPEVPTFLQGLSRSSFYLYLARQSWLSGCDRTTRFWLLKAIKAEFFTPLLRPGFYQLLLHSSLKTLGWSVPAPSSESASNLSLADLQNQRLPIFSKVLVSQVFHGLMVQLFEPPRSRPQAFSGSNPALKTYTS